GTSAASSPRTSCGAPSRSAPSHSNPVCAAVAGAVLTSEGHDGKIYDVTGPEALSAGDVAALFADVGGRLVEPLPVDDDAFGPGAVVVLKPDHVRDVDLFVRWYGTAAFGPQLFWRDDVPRTALHPVHPGDELPGGLRAQYDGRGTQETPVYLPEQQALVFA